MLSVYHPVYTSGAVKGWSPKNLFSYIQSSGIYRFIIVLFKKNISFILCNRVQTTMTFFSVGIRLKALGELSKSSNLDVTTYIGRSQMFICLFCRINCHRQLEQSTNMTKSFSRSLYSQLVQTFTFATQTCGEPDIFFARH